MMVLLMLLTSGCDRRRASAVPGDSGGCGWLASLRAVERANDGGSTDALNEGGSISMTDEDGDELAVSGTSWVVTRRGVGSGLLEWLDMLYLCVGQYASRQKQLCCN
jgi:hypothetical protein